MKSIRDWVTCNGTTDDSLGVAAAFLAARYNAFTLIVDCPVLIHVGTDIMRPIFIDNGTTVEFTGAGKFTVDNVFQPAFVIANSSNITLTNWNVEYNASLPVNPNTGGYENNGQFISLPEKRFQPAFAFNDLRLTHWLSANRKIFFSGSGISSAWWGPTNTSAVFFIIGDVSNVVVTGMKVTVPAAAGGDRFIPMVFSMGANYKSNQAVTPATTRTAQYVAVPHGLTFSKIVLDGIYMGWQGNAQEVTISHIQSHRYGDLQDVNGQNVGGIGKWFAPPHLFYLNYNTAGDPALFNRNISITDVTDDGPRVGEARDKGGTDTISGNALSLKIGCVTCSVTGYNTTRPDGFLDVLASTGLTISNVVATYNSAFLHDLYPGWRFPSSAYKNVTFDNITLKDSAAFSIQPPISGAGATSNENIIFRDVHVEINRWSGKGSMFPNISGQGNEVALDYTTADASRFMITQKVTVSLMLQAAPATLRTGGESTLTWTSKDATSCSASGAWSGVLATAGSRMVRFATAKIYEFTLNCQNEIGSSSTTLPVVVQ
jgi:hypothetical protein